MLNRQHFSFLSILIVSCMILTACAGSAGNSGSPASSVSASSEESSTETGEDLSDSSSDTGQDSDGDDDLMQEMTGYYDCVSGLDGAYMEMYDDYEAIVSLGGKAERMKVTLDRSGFILNGSIDGEDAELMGTYRSGVIHMDHEGSDLTFAKKDTDRWKEWMSTAKDSAQADGSGAAEEEKEEEPSAETPVPADYAGTYTCGGVYIDGLFVTLSSQAGHTTTLDEDGTGYLDWGEDNKGPITEWSIEGPGRIVIKAGVSVMNAMILGDGIMIIDFEDGLYMWYTGADADMSMYTVVSEEEYKEKYRDE